MYDKKSSIYYVTSNKGKFVEADRFLKRHYPQIELLSHFQELDEFQVLDEKKVLEHKAQQAWNSLKAPLLIDDAGIYLHEFPTFPGTLTKPVLDSLGYDGLDLLTKKNKGCEYYVGLSYVDELGKITYFRDSIQGTFIYECSDKIPYAFNYYGHYQPLHAPGTLAQMWDNEDLWKFFPRALAFNQFAKWLLTQK